MSKQEEELKEQNQDETSLLEEEQKIDNKTEETSEDQEDEMDENEKLIEELKEQNEEYLAHIQRLQADFNNYKRQTEKRQTDLISFANEGLLLKILEVYEDFERAKENCKTKEEYSEGLELIYKKLTTIC